MSLTLPSQMKNDPIRSLRLRRSIVALLEEQGVTTLGELAAHLDSLNNISGIGDVRAQEIRDICKTHFEKASKLPSLVLYLSRWSSLVSNLAILAVIAGVLYSTASRIDDGDETWTVIVVGCFLGAFDIGRWITHSESRFQYPLSVGRVRLLIVFLAATVTLLICSKEFGREERIKLTLIGAIFGVWEAGKEFFRYRKHRRGKTGNKSESVTQPTVSTRWSSLHPTVQVALIGLLPPLCSYLISLGGSAAGSTIPPPRQQLDSQKVVNAFYRHLQVQEYQQAWGLLHPSSNLKTSSTLDEFRDGFKYTYAIRHLSIQPFSTEDKNSHVYIVYYLDEVNTPVVDELKDIHELSVKEIDTVTQGLVKLKERVEGEQFNVATVDNLTMSQLFAPNRGDILRWLLRRDSNPKKDAEYLFPGRKVEKILQGKRILVVRDTNKWEIRHIGPLMSSSD